MINEGDIKIAAKLVLTEIPVYICFYINPESWLFEDQETRCEIIWKKLRESHPLTAKIAMLNTKSYKYSTWIESMEILAQ